MGGTCNTYGGKEMCIQEFWWGNLRERSHLENPGVYGRIILRWIFRKWEVGLWTGWIELAQDRDRWRGLVKAVVNVRVP
jgi:hypothetical protein